MITCGGRSSVSGFQGAAALSSETLHPHGGALRPATVVYSTYDGLHEDYFELAEAEHALAASWMATHGADPGLLIQDPA
jgi:hypothetical protein